MAGDSGLQTWLRMGRAGVPAEGPGQLLRLSLHLELCEERQTLLNGDSESNLVHRRMQHVVALS